MVDHLTNQAIENHSLPHQHDLQLFGVASPCEDFVLNVFRSCYLNQWFCKFGYISVTVDDENLQESVRFAPGLALTVEGSFDTAAAGIIMLSCYVIIDCHCHR